MRKQTHINIRTQTHFKLHTNMYYMYVHVLQYLGLKNKISANVYLKMTKIQNTEYGVKVKETHQSNTGATGDNSDVIKTSDCYSVVLGLTTRWQQRAEFHQPSGEKNTRRFSTCLLGYIYLLLINILILIRKTQILYVVNCSN